MANCAYHSERQAVAGCVNCGRLICAECKVKSGGKTYCNPCANEINRGKAKSGGQSSRVQNIEEFQRASDHYLFRKELRGAGIGSIIWGVIAIAVGFGSISHDPINAVLGAIGVFLLIEGIWLRRSPGPRGFIVDGIALCVLGVWNMTVSMISVTGFFAVLGVLQIIFGVWSFRRYRRFSGISPQVPNKETIKQIDDMVKQLRKTSPSQEAAIIQFEAGGGFRSKVWRGKLSGDSGVFITLNGDDLIFARCADVSFTPVGELSSGRQRNIYVKVVNRTFDGKISPESMERYESWKAGKL